jgi:hypothetical protein
MVLISLPVQDLQICPAWRYSDNVARRAALGEIKDHRQSASTRSFAVRTDDCDIRESCVREPLKDL